MDSCKICGAQRDPLATNCKFCNTAYTLEKITGETYVRAFQKMIQDINSDSSPSKWTDDPMKKQNQIANAISSLVMPSDIENLLQFLTFCHGNAQMAVSNARDERVTGAWYGKAKMVFAQLKMKAIANPTIAPYITEYEPIYGVGAKKPMGRLGKFLIGYIVFMIALIIFGAIAHYLK